MNAKVFSEWSGRGLHQGYGPSETTNICNVRSNVMLGDGFHNVGPVFPNTSVFICKRQTQDSTHSEIRPSFDLMPRGALGEIWIGGDQVGRGYMAPGLNKRSFIEHAEYGRLYKSGDIGRLLADESLVILGREDDQVKLRGQRIELGDINTTMLQLDQVKDVFTTITDEGITTARLITFWTSIDLGSRGGPASNIIQALFSELESRLPAYMVPSALLWLEHLPLTRQ